MLVLGRGRESSSATDRHFDRGAGGLQLSITGWHESDIASRSAGMDIQSQGRWVEYSRAKDRMMELTDIKKCLWSVVDANERKRARLNCIAHILTRSPNEDILPEPIALPPGADHSGYLRPSIDTQTFVLERY